MSEYLSESLFEDEMSSLQEPGVVEDVDLSRVLSISTLFTEGIYLQELEILVRSLYSGLPRRSHEWNRVFLLFKTPKHKEPKKEFFRLMNIRGHKDMLRIIYNNISQNREDIYPTKRKNRIKADNPVQRNLWTDLIDLGRAYDLRAISETRHGPLTDGRAWRIGSEEAERSFNDAFLTSYFTTEGVRQSWSKYIELVFSETDLDVLTKKLKVHCCDGNHSDGCWTRWKLLKMYLSIGIMTTLDIDPIEDQQTSWNIQEAPAFL